MTGLLLIQLSKSQKLLALAIGLPIGFLIGCAVMGWVPWTNLQPSEWPTWVVISHSKMAYDNEPYLEGETYELNTDAVGIGEGVACRVNLFYNGHTTTLFGALRDPRDSRLAADRFTIQEIEVVHGEVARAQMYQRAARSYPSPRELSSVAVFDEKCKSFLDRLPKKARDRLGPYRPAGDVSDKAREEGLPGSIFLWSKNWKLLYCFSTLKPGSNVVHKLPHQLTK